VTAACAGPNAKDQYNVFNPTPADKMRGFSTDRLPRPANLIERSTSIGLVSAAVPYQSDMGIAQRF
jgi:hypothetical protein